MTSGLRARCWQDSVPSGGSRAENLFPCSFQLLEATCIPWLVAPSPPPKPAMWGRVLPHLSPSFTVEEPYDHTESHV